MKNVKVKVKKIQILSSRAAHSVAVILLIDHIGYMDLWSRSVGVLNLTLG